MYIIIINKNNRAEDMEQVF